MSVSKSRNNARILTTTVGSYPVPDWLVALPSEQAVIDATRVVIDTQEQAGIDLVCDGELYRFDVNHPETNGMIEYFVRPMSGVRNDMGLAEWLAFKQSLRSQLPQPSAGRGRQRHRSGFAGSAGRLRARKKAGDEAAEIHAHRPAHAGQDAAGQPLQGQGGADDGDRGCVGRTGQVYRRRSNPGR